MLLIAALITAGLLLFLLYWQRGMVEDVSLHLRAYTLPPQPVVDRIFSKEDLRYSRSFPKHVQALFVRDRRILALTWIRQVRQVTVLLTRQHVRLVRGDQAVSFWKEVKIAASFVSLLFTCELLVVAVTALGPVRTRILLSSLGTRLHSLQLDMGVSYMAAYTAA